jgi:hypothetical protein
MIAKLGMQIIETAKLAVKEHHSSKNPIIRSLVIMLYTFRDFFKSAKRICLDEDFRSILLLQLLNAKNVHQTTALTYMDRYPNIFSACREFFDEKKDLKILSYGCSTGEEVLTLRRYFPTAQIIGADINKHSLEICKKIPVDEKITFIYSTPSEIQKYGPFDAIFCMAVLQRKPHYIAAEGINSLKKIYPFEKFERQILELDEVVKPQGLLIVHFTQYSLNDTSIATKYEALGDYNQNDYLSPVFDKNCNLIKNQTGQNSIFVKLHD